MRSVVPIVDCVRLSDGFRHGISDGNIHLVTRGSLRAHVCILIVHAMPSVGRSRWGASSGRVRLPWVFGRLLSETSHFPIRVSSRGSDVYPRLAFKTQTEKETEREPTYRQEIVYFLS